MNITERFLKYVGYGTNSDEKSETCPSTPNQLAARPSPVLTLRFSLNFRLSQTPVILFGLFFS